MDRIDVIALLFRLGQESWQSEREKRRYRWSRELVNAGFLAESRSAVGRWWCLGWLEEGPVLERVGYWLALSLGRLRSAMMGFCSNGQKSTEMLMG